MGSAAMLSARTSVMRATSPSRRGSVAARSRASCSNAAITGSLSNMVTVKPAAARSRESCPKPAVASTAVGETAPLILAARTKSSRDRFACLRRGSISAKSPRSTMPSRSSERPPSSNRNAKAPPGAPSATLAPVAAATEATRSGSAPLDATSRSGTWRVSIIIVLSWCAWG